jgi:hypothetical protein
MGIGIPYTPYSPYGVDFVYIQNLPLSLLLGISLGNHSSGMEPELIPLRGLRKEGKSPARNGGKGTTEGTKGIREAKREMPIRKSSAHLGKGSFRCEIRFFLALLARERKKPISGIRFLMGYAHYGRSFCNTHKCVLQRSP